MGDPLPHAMEDSPEALRKELDLFGDGEIGAEDRRELGKALGEVIEFHEWG